MKEERRRRGREEEEGSSFVRSECGRQMRGTRLGRRSKRPERIQRRKTKGGGEKTPHNRRHHESFVGRELLWQTTALKRLAAVGEKKAEENLFSPFRVFYRRRAKKEEEGSSSSPSCQGGICVSVGRSVSLWQFVTTAAEEEEGEEAMKAQKL